MITTADFVVENLLEVDCFDDKFNLLKSSVNLAKKDGLWLEFGVYKGMLTNFISNIKNQTIQFTVLIPLKLIQKDMAE